MNTLSRSTTKDANEIRDIAGKLELKSLQDAQNLAEYQANVRNRTHQIAHPPPPTTLSYATTITQPPPSMPVPITGALPGSVMTSSIPTPVIAATHSTPSGTKPEEEEYWAKVQ